MEEGGLVIAELSDLVQRSGGESQENNKESPPSSAPVNSEPGPVAPPVADRPPRGEADDRPQHLPYQLARQELARILEAVGLGETYTVAPLGMVVGDMAQALTRGDDLLAQAQEPGDPQLDLARHMVNVAIFAMKIGQGVGCSDDELPWLGLAACLHDVGMVTVPRPILEKLGPLTPKEMVMVRQHPENGFRILQKLGPEFEGLANVGLQEHEREDGSGYPRGLAGDQIQENAKIVGLADVYEALSHHRPYRPMSSPVDVVKKLITAERRLFSARILKGFIRGLSAFPIGSVVCLNSMEVGRIVATNPALPLRPVIEILQGPKGERPERPRRLDLAINTLLYITGSYSGKVAA